MRAEHQLRNFDRALEAYAAERRAQTGKMIERARARGDVAADVDPAIVADFLSSFAWGHLLTGRLDVDEKELKAVARLIAHGVKGSCAMEKGGV